MRREKKERLKKMNRMRKGIYILPNLITAGSLFCGFFALLRTLQEDFYVAAIFIGSVNTWYSGGVGQNVMYGYLSPLRFGITGQIFDDRVIQIQFALTLELKDCGCNKRLGQ